MGMNVTLTDQERDIIRGVALGDDARALAEQLGLTVHQLSIRKSVIFAKLGAKNAPNMVFLAYKYNLL